MKTPSPLFMQAGRTLFLAVCLLLSAARAFANVTNEGNDAVQIKVYRANGFSQFYTLYPGQSIAIPDKSTRLELEPRSSGARGDESIKVKVVLDDGSEIVLDGYGQSCQLDKPPDTEEASKVKLQYGKIMNRGNNVVTVDVKDDKNLVNRRVIYPGQPLAVAPDTVEVTVVNNGLLRGDEIVKVQVILPDGEDITITSVGGVAKMKKEE